MSFRNGVLEGSKLDFGGPGTRFWQVLGSFFQDFGPLGRRNAGTDFELEAKAVQLQLGAQVASSSFPLPRRSSATIFYLKVGPRSSAGVGGRRCPPPGGFQSSAHRRWCRACWIINQSSSAKRQAQSQMANLKNQAHSARLRSYTPLFFSPQVLKLG